MSSSDDDDIALGRLPSKHSSASRIADSDDDDDEVPLSQLSNESPQKPTTTKSIKRSKSNNNDLVKRQKLNKKSKTIKQEKVKSEKTSKKSNPQLKSVVKKGKKEKKPSKPKTETKTPKTRPIVEIPTPGSTPTPTKDENNKDSENGDEDDDSFKWWEADDLDGEQKWETLEHNGVIFPPDYEPLPSHVKLFYEGKPLDLPPEAEEVAGFFAAMIETDHAKNPVFQKNFFNDFKTVLKECNHHLSDSIEFEKCDFSKMAAYFQQQREEKKLMSKEEKNRLKLEKEKLEAPYKFCILNGRKEGVGNFRIEPPGLFRGRGAHPKTGKLKRRVLPEQVTLNLGPDAPVPPPPKGHNWQEIVHNKEVTWLATWKENISDATKYVRFANNSSIKGQSDFKKFETARNLKHHIEAIRKDYNKMLKSELMQARQMATATYLIDVFALRAGGEKSEEEADTVGCCSLRYEHITLEPPNKVTFDFLGKDSIRFYQQVEVDKQVFKNLMIFKKAPKTIGDDLFDRINPGILNKHLTNYMKGLTAKVFRTYNASKTMQDQLDLIPNEGTVAEKVLKFNAANRTVAILCNHQRTVAKSHGDSVQKIMDKIQELVWQKIRYKRMILQLEPNLLKKDKKYFAEINDLTKEDEEQIHESIIARQRQQVEKKFQRDNEKLKLEGKKEMSSDELDERLKKVVELEKEYQLELKTGIIDMKKSVTVEKLKSQIETVETRIVHTEIQLKDKEDNSEVSLGTSKMNYIDPRLTVMFSKKFDVPIEKLFTKTLRDKFTWAIESTDENWRF